MDIESESVKVTTQEPAVNHGTLCAGCGEPCISGLCIKCEQQILSSPQSFDGSEQNEAE